MASNVQNYLTNLEITPPPGAWSAIAARLETEYGVDETVVAEKLQDITIIPPALAWENIAAALPGSATPIEQPKVVRLPYRRVRMLAAASVIGLVGLTAWYFLNYTGTPTGAAVQQQQAATPATENKTTPDNNNTASIAPAIEQLQEQLAQETPEPVTRYTSQAVTRRIPIYFKYDDQPMATFAGPEEDAIRFTGSTTPSVEAPLIRDANGQIILDKRLITSPDNNYITITGPNGEQTRISAKFLDIISSLNADAEPSSDYFNYMMHDNNLWKARFHEWRSKLMNQASFVPTATNFLDILELKELLQENQ
jgi:hypothetical protein